MPHALLPDRALLFLSGKEARPFLQGLVTVNMEKISSTHPAYGLLLSPQGRYLHDFFILEWDNGLLLDTQASRAEELRKRLKLYKLKRDVQFESLELSVTAVWGDAPVGQGVVIEDPRNAHMGWRVYGAAQPEGVSDSAAYEMHRLSLGVIDAGRDMSVDRSLPLDFGMEQFNAVDFTKGCYVGQEVTARMHYKAQPRRAVHKVRSQDGKALPEKGTTILAGEEKAGEMLSSQASQGLALIKRDMADKSLHFEGVDTPFALVP